MQLVQQIEELRAAYLREDLPENLTAAVVEEEISRHADTRHAINKEYAETVAMAKALIDRMQLSRLYDEDGETESSSTSVGGEPDGFGRKEDRLGEGVEGSGW